MGLDTVELVLTWESGFGVAISDSEASQLRRVSDAISLISSQLEADSSPSFCPAQRAFHILRRSVRQATEDPQRQLKLNRQFPRLNRHERQRFESHMEEQIGLTGFRDERWTIRNTIISLVATDLWRLKRPDEPWTEELVRIGVRYAIQDFAIDEFSDDARFIEDLGID